MKMTRAFPLAIAAITLLAFALRAYHLDGQSLWYDEGFSVYLAQKSLGEITTRTAADIQPPVYYYLLHAWMLLVGRSEFSVRFLSVLFGVLSIPLAYQMGRRLLNPLAGLLAALFLAVSPFHVWYAQETRMYTLVTMLGMLSSWLLLRLCRSGILPDEAGAGQDARPTDGAGAGQMRGSVTGQDARPTMWALYALVNIVAVYTHYYAFFLVAFQALYLVAWWLWHGRPRATLIAGLAAQAATALAYLPWAGFALNRYAVDESYWQGVLSLDFVRKTLLAFSAGQTVFEVQAQAIAIGYVVLLAVGIAALVIRTRPPTPQAWGDAASEPRRTPPPPPELGAGEQPSAPPDLGAGRRRSAPPDLGAWGQPSAPPDLGAGGPSAAPPDVGAGGPSAAPPELGAGGQPSAPPGLGGRGAKAAIFLLLYLIVPFVLLYLLSAARPKFNPRYLMLVSPAFFLLIAAGLARLLHGQRRLLWRALAAAGLLYVLATSGYALANNYTNHVYVRDDFRSVAQRIAADRQPGEAVILCSGHMFPVYAYYAPDDPAYRIPDSETLSTRNIVTYDVVDRLNEIAAGRSGVWLVLWQNDVVDPTGILTSLLDAQAERLPVENIYWGIELRHYRLPAGVRFVAPRMAGLPNVNFANKLSLVGMNLTTPTVTSGDYIALTLFWQAQQPLDEDYWVALRLVDQFGHVVSSLNDHLAGYLNYRPAGYTYPTTLWQPRVTVPGAFRLLVMPATAPGDYKLQVIVFSLARAQNLDVLDERGAPAGVSAIVGAVAVHLPAQPPAIESIGLANVLRLPLGDNMELLATSLSDRSVRQGETVSFAIAWRNSARLTQDYTALLRLTADGKVLQEISAPLAGPNYPSSAWPAGSIVRSQYELTIPADAPARVQVEVGLQGAGAAQTIARLTVSQVARSTAMPAMQHAQKAQFGALATLLGYDLAAAAVKPGETLNLTLYWEAGAGDGQGLSYTVFTHLLGADNVFYGQHDRPPAEGTRPTTGWLPGEIIVDKHTLVVKPDAPPGEYSLEIGLYDPATDRRLEATSDDGSRGDHIILATRVRVQ